MKWIAPVAARAALCLLVLRPDAVAQRYSFKYYGQEHGLSNLATESLLQDRTGYLWVGTQNGLFRYDGSGFMRYGEEDGLPGAPIQSLLETPDGVLWVATSHGLAWRQRNRFERIAIGHGVESSGKFGLASDGARGLYVTTMSGLLYSPEPRAGGFRPVANQTGQPAYGLHVDASGTVWYGCGSAVCRWTKGALTVFDQTGGVPADRWDAILTRKDGSVWIRSSTHLLTLDPGEDRFRSISEPIPHRGDFATLSAGRDGELFVPTDEGVWELSNGRWRAIGPAQGLTASAIGAVLQDREGSMWIGLWGAGLARWLGRNEWEAWTRADGLTGEHVWKMLRDSSGDLWVATDKGVNRMHLDARTSRPVWKAITEREGLAGNQTRAMALGPDGSVWVGSSPGGISRIFPATGRVRRYAMPEGPGYDRIWHLRFDSTGRLWVSTRGGLFYMNPGSTGQSFQRQDLPLGDPAETVSMTLEDRRGRFWVAGTRGLARRENGTWKRFTVQDGLPTTAAGFLAEAPDGAIWLGYRDRTGVSRLEVDGDSLKVQTWDQTSGLRSDQAIFVRVDHRGWVWFGTDRGVDVWQDGTWRHFGQQNGLIWDDCNTDAFLEDPDGSVWIGTSRGLAHFRPARPMTSASGPQVEFAHFQLGENVRDPRSVITESWQNRTLTARLSVLTFLAERDVICRYRLAGLDEEWVETRQREIRFPNLPAGKFVLEAIGRDSAGNWSAVPARAAFEIRPPWWGTWWFRTLLAVAGGILVAGVYRWRTRMLIASRCKLEAAVEERTRQLRAEQERIQRQNSEIERLLEQAQQASVFKTQFLANMSHEIRTPINGILGMVNLTLATHLEPDQKDALETARACARSLLGILNDVLDVSKIEAGKLDIALAPFRVAEVVASACGTFTSAARQKGIDLSWEIVDGVPEWLECDAARIRQVLLNLVGNAVKFTHHGSVHVRAEAEEGEAGAVNLCFAVTDTGIGVPEEARELIFEAFRQADGSTSRHYGGTGLGLTISTRLVQLMGGRITLESNPGAGSSFRFWVATRRASGPSESSLPLPGNGCVQGEAPRRLRILLAEDNVVNQRVATGLLNRRGHTVVVVANGLQAVERCRQESFDAVLMDLQMPEMDGWAATREIRAKCSSGMPIIALTAHAMSHVQNECLAAGMDAVVVKPFDPSQLFETVERAAQRCFSVQVQESKSKS